MTLQQNAAPLTLPAHITLDTLNDARLQVKEPIAVLLFAAEGFIVAEAPELSECGDGRTAAEAIADLQDSIADLYWTLEEKQDHLAAGLQQTWQTLQTKVTRR